MGCITGILRILMFIINVTVCIAGAGLLGIGIWMSVDTNTFEYLFTEDTLTVVSIVTICTGTVMFILGFCGCLGASKRNKCLLSTYVAILGILVVAMLATGITALVYFDTVEDYMEDRIYTIIVDEYGDKLVANQTIDGLQEDLNCCGSKSPKDWADSNYWNHTEQLPASCCKDNQDCVDVPYPFDDDTVNQQGCYESFNDWINDHIGIIAGVSLGFILIVVLAMVFGCCMIKDKDQYEYA
ncbi:tetraspanin-1-like [Antedon mediterranea]|uniref:tetraspanin-1-like n=1 Tax=Antedon mediterranea TaxID=105859 RepID=UPI003AF7FEE9